MDTKKSAGSSYVGLFWFQNDYQSIVHTEGDHEFFARDIEAKNTVLPKGTHRSFSVDSPYALPRGRIEVEGGKVIVSIGLNCPDSALEQVFKDYGLCEYRNVMEIRRNKFWNKRM